MLVGVTGNLASGKSAFMHILTSLGFETHYSDKIVKYLYKQKDVVDLIGNEFGSGVVNAGSVDKNLLGVIVFNNNEKLEKLNKLIHPIVKEKILEINHSNKIVFVELTLLFEAHMEKLFDKIVLIKCSTETARKRAESKGFTEAEFNRRIASQWPAEKKISKSDFVVDSEGTMSSLTSETEKLAQKLREQL